MEASNELEGIIRGWFACVARGDASWIDRHLSTDSRLRIVGTDPDEWFLGEQAANLLRSDLANLGGNVTIDVRDIEAYTEGNVGWGVASIVVKLPNDASVAPRWSAVFHREGNEWRAVQVHASVGLSNEQVFGG